MVILSFRSRSFTSTKQLKGSKKDKERVIIVVCCNSDDLDKIPLCVIGRFANPICLKNVNMNNLICHYLANRKNIDN